MQTPTSGLRGTKVGAAALSEGDERWPRSNNGHDVNKLQTLRHLVPADELPLTQLRHRSLQLTRVVLLFGWFGFELSFALDRSALASINFIAALSRTSIARSSIRAKLPSAAGGG
jgi:hypothetical protein